MACVITEATVAKIILFYTYLPALFTFSMDPFLQVLGGVAPFPDFLDVKTVKELSVSQSKDKISGCQKVKLAQKYISYFY
jgi:hypothetical protein